MINGSHRHLLSGCSYSSISIPTTYFQIQGVRLKGGYSNEHGDCEGLQWTWGDREPDQGGQKHMRWDKTSCSSFDANHARLKMGVLAYNLLHMIREFYLFGEEVRR